MLNEIRDCLEQLNLGPVMYGRATNVPDQWNYIVFARRNLKNGTNIDKNRYYNIVIVHEDYIPEGTEISVLKELKNVKGLHIANDDIQYDYMVKKDTQTVVEMAVITVYEIIKGYKV